MRSIDVIRLSSFIGSSSPCRPARRRRRCWAVRGLAREKFGRRHRYAMVLHTDEPHPHVHVVVKAVSEAGGTSCHCVGFGRSPYSAESRRAAFSA
ncbi:MAG: relaxase/mobilization nuclease domain-containing protein [Steroidobacter sp.]|nr:relaxase/mobilization nuclease domain-containing protein [Steroidobacter sp.]